MLAGMCHMRRKSFDLQAAFFCQGLLQIDKPVRLVNEVFPALVSRIAEFQRKERASPRSHRLPNQLHPRFVGGSPTLSDIAGHAGADDVFPTRCATSTPRHNMVQRQFAHRKLLSAILTTVPIAGEDVATIEPQRLPRHAVTVR